MREMIVEEKEKSQIDFERIGANESFERFIPKWKLRINIIAAIVIYFCWVWLHIMCPFSR